MQRYRRYRGISGLIETMSGHKFKSGQLVHYCPKSIRRVSIDLASGLYQIIKRLPPADDGEPQYEIRDTLEQHDRVARESELMR